ncbi:MAG: hypothetical protein JWL83_62 [Actinomycetia bacterium]|nr:hypothetical protein [Actinomycetes bacterium]
MAEISRKTLRNAVDGMYMAENLHPETPASSEMPRFARDGSPIATLEEWADLYRDPAYRMIAADTVEGTDQGVRTCWIGFDVFKHTPPRIFETQVFKGSQAWVVESYATEEQARAGHRQRLSDLRSMLASSTKS